MGRNSLAALLSTCGVLLAGCGPDGSASPAAQSPPTSVVKAERCPPGAKGQGVRIRQVRAEEDRRIMTVEPNPELGGEASLAWRGDLNRDGREDLILRFHELCGNQGECPWGVYAGCGGDRFVTLWGPEYVVQLQPFRADPRNGWVEIGRTVRKTTATRDYASKGTLAFVNGAYREQRRASKSAR